ncbi:MazG nucleotide pyrophosphohydrolase domain-containing protein, partial [Salmonella enterica]|uniref:MazG nucleotide pyrophosphohydrolase domain-containing protein n=1 Tax=Salmonella enterica TaxID=28901 RepID=UPI000CB853C0
IDEITSENGDIWIKQQTNQTLAKYFKEESDEFLEALEAGDLDNMVEELGDVLMQIMYQANLAEKDVFFSIEDVLSAINRKLRRRHPHV